jgi:hypothetical protein
LTIEILPHSSAPEITMAVELRNTVGREAVQPSDPASQRGAPNQDDVARPPEGLVKAMKALAAERSPSEATLSAVAMEMQKWTLATNMPSKTVQMLSDQLKSVVQNIR